MFFFPPFSNVVAQDDNKEYGDNLARWLLPPTRRFVILLSSPVLFLQCQLAAAARCCMLYVTLRSKTKKTIVRATNRQTNKQTNKPLSISVITANARELVRPRQTCRRKRNPVAKYTHHELPPRREGSSSFSPRVGGSLSVLARPQLILSPPV